MKIGISDFSQKICWRKSPHPSQTSYTGLRSERELRATKVPRPDSIFRRGNSASPQG